MEQVYPLTSHPPFANSRQPHESSPETRDLIARCERATVHHNLPILAPAIFQQWNFLYELRYRYKTCQQHFQPLAFSLIFNLFIKSFSSTLKGLRYMMKKVIRRVVLLGWKTVESTSIETRDAAGDDVTSSRRHYPLLWRISPSMRV